MLSKKEIEKIANLARIKLTEKEKEKMASELASTLGYIDKLKEVNTDNVEINENPHHSLLNVLRADGIYSHKSAENTERLLSQAPEIEGGFVKVKNIFSRPKVEKK